MRARIDRGDHRPPPAGILEEAERRTQLVVAARQLLEQLQRVLLARRAWCRAQLGAGLQRRLHLVERLAVALEPTHQRRQDSGEGGEHLHPRAPAGEQLDHDAAVATYKTRPVAPQTLPRPRQLAGRVGDHDPGPEPQDHPAPPLHPNSQVGPGFRCSLDREHERIPLRVAREIREHLPDPVGRRVDVDLRGENFHPFIFLRSLLASRRVKPVKRGGRAEPRILRSPVPVVYVDFLSMYPTGNSLARRSRSASAAGRGSVRVNGHRASSQVRCVRRKSLESRSGRREHDHGGTLSHPPNEDRRAPVSRKKLSPGTTPEAPAASAFVEGCVALRVSRGRCNRHYQAWYREQRGDRKRASDRRWRERVGYNAQRRKPTQQRVCAEPDCSVVFETAIPHRLYCSRSCKKRADNRRFRGSGSGR